MRHPIAHAMPSTAKIQYTLRQPWAVMRAMTTHEVIAKPIRLPNITIDWARPSSWRGNHRAMAEVAPGNAPASPQPNRKRIATSAAKFQAAPVRAVNTDHQITILVSISRAP